MMEESSEGEVEDWRGIFRASTALAGGVRGGETRRSPSVGETELEGNIMMDFKTWIDLPMSTTKSKRKKDPIGP